MSEKQYCKQYGALRANPERLAEHKEYQKKYRQAHRVKLMKYQREIRKKRRKARDSTESEFLRQAQKSLDNDMKELNKAKRHIKFLDYARKVRHEANRIIEIEN